MPAISVLESGNFCLKLLGKIIHCTKSRTTNVCVRLPEQGKRFVAAAGDERHLDALSPDLITVQTTDGTDGLAQAEHLDGGLQLIVSMGAELHIFHLEKKNSYTTKITGFMCELMDVQYVIWTTSILLM